MEVIITPQTSSGPVRGPKRCAASEGLVFTMRSTTGTKASTLSFTAVAPHPSDPDRMLLGDTRGTVVHVSLARNRHHVVCRLGAPVTHIAYLTNSSPLSCVATVANHIYVVGIEDSKVHHRLRAHANNIDASPLLFLASRTHRGPRSTPFFRPPRGPHHLNAALRSTAA